MPKKALFIGINYVNTPNELSGCINDTINMQKYLTTKWGLKPESTRVLTDDTVVKPTKQNILTNLRWLVSDLKPHDTCFLHYSGHGGYVQDKQATDEDDKKDETICPLSGGNITDDELRKCLIDKLPRDSTLIAVFDCCHSGTILDLRFNYKVDTSLNDASHAIYVRENYLTTKANVYLFSGCMDNQTSADSFEENQAQGAMTYGFLETVENIPVLTYGSMIKNIQKVLKDKGYTQIPQLSCGRLVDLDTAFRV